MTNLMSESSSVIFYAKCGIGKLIKRWLGVEHDIVFFSSVGEAVKSAKMYLHKSFVNSIKNKSVKNWNILGFIITIENLTVATKWKCARLSSHPLNQVTVFQFFVYTVYTV